MKIADFSIKHPVVITIILAAVILFGSISLTSLRQEMFPDIGMPSIMVYTIYPGVGPTDVEREVTDILENALADLSGVKKMTSSSEESVSLIQLEFDWGTNLDLQMPKIREKINEVRNLLPDGIEGEPAIRNLGSSLIPILSVAVESEMSREDLSDFITNSVKPGINRISGVSSVNLHGNVINQLNVMLNVDKLEAKNISILDIYQTLQYNNISLPAGGITYRGQSINMRTYGEFSNIDEIESLVVGYKDGSYIRLQDVADIQIGEKKVDSYTMSNGVPIVVIDVLKQTGTDTNTIVKNIKKVFKKIEKEYGGIVKFSDISNQSKDVTRSINSVRNSAIMGGIFAILILFLFLRNFRVTLIISTSIPLSVLITFVVIKLTGKSLNILTLSGLTVGIGMIVDSSIVVLENIFKIFQKNKNAKIAASEGTSEVTGAIIASTSTSLAVFIPIMLAPGFAGLILSDLSLVVIASLAASMVVSIIVVPYLSSLFLKETEPPNINYNLKSYKNKKINEFHNKLNKFNIKLIMFFSIFRNIFAKFSRLLDRAFEKFEKKYLSILKVVLKNRLFVFSVAIGILILSFFVFNMIGFEFLQESDMSEIEFYFDLPSGISLEKNAEKMNKIDSIIRESVPEIDTLVFYVGMSSSYATSKRNNVSYARLKLLPRKKRKRSVFEIIEVIREKTSSNIPDVNTVIVNGGFGSLVSLASGGTGYIIEVFGNNLDDVYKMARMIQKIFEENSNVAKTEINLKFDRQEMIIDLMLDYMGNLGVTPYETALTSRILFHGMNAGVFRTEKKKYDIFLKSNLADQPINRDTLNKVLIKSHSGQFISLANLTNIKPEKSVSSIPHKNRMKSVYVTAYLKKNDFKQMQQVSIPKIENLNKPMGVDWSISGQAKEMASSFTTLLISLVIAIFLVYMVMVIQFERFTQPFIVLFSIPFTIIGVALGLLIFNSSFSIVSFLGIIMLAGIVVNNAIVMIDYINLLRSKYKRGLKAAILQGASSRLKPILMTTLTTVLGIIPMALGLGEGSEVYAPLGQAVVGGLLTSTLITLFLIPVMYYTFEKRAIKRKRKKELHL